VTQPRQGQGLSFLWHALSKAGKSTLSDTGPQPRLVIDIEGASWLTPSRKTWWDPRRQPVPQPPGRHLTAGYGPVSQTPEWETCIALCPEAPMIEPVYQVLNSGRHPFNSLSVDSLTEMQQRIIDQRSGFKKVERDDWGALLREISGRTRRFRDLTSHPVKPLWSVSFVCGTRFFHDVQKFRPLVQGRVGDFLPYYVDVLGYLEAQQNGQRLAYIGPLDKYETGERVQGRLPFIMPLGYPGNANTAPLQGFTVETMVRQVLAGR
jgi:hypothetical protein